MIATTRFPKDAAQRFAQEKDFAEWKDRLHIYGLDMRQLPAVERFCEHLLATYPHLDMIMYAHHPPPATIQLRQRRQPNDLLGVKSSNNAAQTVRKPTGFYGMVSPI